MKYGVLVNKYCRNLGDDVQSYAEAQFLPRIDYLVDREEIDSFQSKDGEKVATILGAWWMKRKWNFPPSNCIYPLLTAMHVSLETLEINSGHPGRSPIKDEWLGGVGGDYLKAYGPVGARDIKTQKAFEEYGIPTYFSGCSTLTLPKQKLIESETEYICLVDVAPEVEKKIREDIENSSIEIRIMSHTRLKERTEEEASDWEFRKREVEELLTIYQNAKCVITRRLHVSLPCLAMDVPVLCVFPDEAIIDRLEPYKDWLHFVRVTDFLNGDYDYDIENPKPNKTEYLEFRKTLTEQMEAFVAEVDKFEDLPIKTTYTDEEKVLWQNQLMKMALTSWQPLSLKMHRRITKLEKKRKELSIRLKKKNIKIAKLKKRIAILKKRIADLKKSNAEKKQNQDLYKRMRHFGGRVLRKLKLKK